MLAWVRVPPNATPFWVFSSVPPRLLSTGLVGDVWACTHICAVSRGQATRTNIHGHSTTRCGAAPKRRTPTADVLARVPRTPHRQKKVMAVPGFEPGSSGSQPLMLTTTLYHHGWNSRRMVELNKVRWMDYRSKCLFVVVRGSATCRHTIALIAQLGER